MRLVIPALNLSDDEAEALLLAEGDRLAARLVQQFPVSTQDLERAYFVGRTVAVNLTLAFVPTAETITRRLKQPLSLFLSADERGRAELLAVNADGEAQESLPVDDLLERALYRRGLMIGPVEAEVYAALTAPNERGATLAMIRLLRLPAVLEATRFYLNRYAGRG